MGDESIGESDYLDPYREAVRDAGPRFESLLWKSPEAQQLRFDVIIDVCDLHGRVVVDLGAGLGDLAVRMHRRGIEYGRYIGVEGVPELAEEGEKKLAAAGVPECVWRTGDFVADEGLFGAMVRNDGAEVFAFSGSLNTLNQPDAERVLGRAWEAVSRSQSGQRGGQLVFNFLSDRARRKNESTGPAHRYDPARLVAWALDRTPLVVLRHDYWGGHDATVWMGVG